jgi:Subtilase family
MRSSRHIKIAIVDSGITPGHVHVGAVAGGVSFAGEGEPIDRLGHGTAVAGAIRQWTADADLYAVRVFDRRLSANIETIVRALEWCRDQEMDIVNLSLGTANPAHRERFLAVLGRPLVVSPAGLLPGSLDGVAGVEADAECPRDAFRYRDGVFYASPYPRPIPGVPVERNLSGVSFAVANLTGLAAGSNHLSCEALIRSVTNT